MLYDYTDITYCVIYYMINIYYGKTDSTKK